MLPPSRVEGSEDRASRVPVWVSEKGGGGLLAARHEGSGVGHTRWESGEGQGGATGTREVQGFWENSTDLLAVGGGQATWVPCAP